MNKEIVEIKKLYQSTKDGGDVTQFHKLCDNIPNTLVLYKSAVIEDSEDLLLNVGIQIALKLRIKIVFYFLWIKIKFIFRNIMTLEHLSD